MKKKLFLLFIILANNSFAADAELLFHVGMQDDNKQVIGLTIDNKVNSEMYHYYVTYILLDDKCQPGPPIVAEIKDLTANQKSTINIPVTGDFSYYRIVDFFAYNNMGIPLSVSDETKHIILGRDSIFAESCEKARKIN